MKSINYHTLSRKEFLKRSAKTAIVLPALLTDWFPNSILASNLKAEHEAEYLTHPPKAKSMIMISLFGGPSQIELFDYKPMLEKMDGKSIDTKKFNFFHPESGTSRLRKSIFPFKQHGQAGHWISNVLPNISTVADEITFLKSCTSKSNSHAPANLQMNTGSILEGFPSLGSWLNYAIGTNNKNLPGNIIMFNPEDGEPEPGQQNWTNGFLPGNFQGVVMKSEGSPFLFLTPPKDVEKSVQSSQFEMIKKLNMHHIANNPGHQDLYAQQENYNLAENMIYTGSIFDLESESPATKSMYGIDNPVTSKLGKQLLLARKLVENGVRFIQIYHSTWDSHDDLDQQRVRASESDKPVASLIKDLKQRGLLDETLVFWSSEFGRMPVIEGKFGRDHNPHGFTLWLAGGGIKKGFQYGETDEIGYEAVNNVITWPDLHATILHLFGIEHEKLIYQFNGRKFRLTDVSGEVIKEILA